MTLDPEQRQLVHDLLAGAVPVSPSQVDTHKYISREEFEATISTIESKIENATLKQRNWVLVGCLAIIVSGGSGYVSVMSKLDRLTEALPTISQKVDNRSEWIQRVDIRDQRQDDLLRKLDNSYQPIPYPEAPQ